MPTVAAAPGASSGVPAGGGARGRRRERSALAVPNFRLYFASAVVAQSGGWLLRTAQAWLVLEMTGTPAALAVVTIAQALPVTILTLFAGVLIDRTQSRRLLVLVQLVISVETAIMAVLVLSQQIQFWHVVVLAVVLGVASAIDFPTRSSIVSELVEPGLVPNGVALNSALNSAARIIGPGVGGLMIAVWGSGVCFAVTAVIYGTTTLGLVRLRGSAFYPKRLAVRAPILSQLAEGLRYSFSTPMLAVNMLLAGFYGTFAYNWALVLPLLARFALNSGAEGFGALNMAMGVGSSVGAFLLATRVRASLRLLLISGLGLGAAMVVLAHAPNELVAVGVLVFTGALMVLFQATNNTLLQIESREDIRGRVLSLFTFLTIGSTPVGGAFTGYVADGNGIQTALQVNATVCLLGLALAVLLVRRTRGSRPEPDGAAREVG